MREIAKRARGTPRIAGRLLRRVVDFALVEGDGKLTRALGRQRADPAGRGQAGAGRGRPALPVAAGGKLRRWAGGRGNHRRRPVRKRDAIEEVIEPYLLQQGLIARTPRGRMLAAKAWAHLGLPMPQARAAGPFVRRLNQGSVARTHQPGCGRLRWLAAARSAPADRGTARNRSRRTPTCAPARARASSARSTSAITGTARRPGLAGRCVARPATHEPAKSGHSGKSGMGGLSLRAKRRNTAGVDTPTRGLTSTIAMAAARDRASPVLADAAHPAGFRGHADRHIRAQRQHIVRQRDAPSIARPAQGRRRVRRAAADTRGHGQVLFQFQRQPVRLHQPRGLQHKIVALARQARPLRARSRTSDSPRCRCAQNIASVGEYDQRIQQVIAVAALPDHVQRQIDLGRGARPVIPRRSSRRAGFCRLRSCDAPARCPDRDAARKDSARRHWKRASRSRPTAQYTSPRWSFRMGSVGISSTARSMTGTASS